MRHDLLSDPLPATFKKQRDGARARGIAWELEYWEWLQIWQDSGHLHERGPKKGQWVMGRNGDTGPYAAGNVKIIRSDTNNSDRERPTRIKADRNGPV